MTPITHLLTTIRDAFDSDDPNYGATLDTDRTFRITITRIDTNMVEGEETKEVSYLPIEIEGIIPRLSLNGEDTIWLTPRDRWELFRFRWQIRRQNRRDNRENIPNLCDKIRPTSD